MTFKLIQVSNDEFIVYNDDCTCAIIEQGYDSVRYSDCLTTNLSARKSLFFNKIILYNDAFTQIGCFGLTAQPIPDTGGYYNKLMFEGVSYAVMDDRCSLVVQKGDSVVAVVRRTKNGKTNEWLIQSDTSDLVAALSLIVIQRAVKDVKEGVWVMVITIVSILLSVGAILLWVHFFGTTM